MKQLQSSLILPKKKKKLPSSLLGHYLPIYIQAKFKLHIHDDYRSITILSIKCLISSFYILKLCIKDEFMDQIENNIRLV